MLVFVHMELKGEVSKFGSKKKANSWSWWGRTRSWEHHWILHHLCNL